MTTIAKLTGIAIEFFWGEALYEMSDQLRRLRKWRLITMSLPLAGLVMVTWAALAWPQIPDEWQPPQKYDERVAYQRLESLEVVVVDMRLELSAINSKLDLVGWLIGAAVVGFVSQTFGYFYQLRLRKTLRGIEKREV